MGKKKKIITKAGIIIICFIILLGLNNNLMGEGIDQLGPPFSNGDFEFTLDGNHSTCAGQANYDNTMEIYENEVLMQGHAWANGCGGATSRINLRTQWPNIPITEDLNVSLKMHGRFDILKSSTHMSSQCGGGINRVSVFLYVYDQNAKDAIARPIYSSGSCSHTWGSGGSSDWDGALTFRAQVGHHYTVGVILSTWAAAWQEPTSHAGGGGACGSAELEARLVVTWLGITAEHPPFIDLDAYSWPGEIHDTYDNFESMVDIVENEPYHYGTFTNWLSAGGDYDHSKSWASFRANDQRSKIIDYNCHDHKFDYPLNIYVDEPGYVAQMELPPASSMPLRGATWVPKFFVDSEADTLLNTWSDYIARKFWFGTILGYIIDHFPGEPIVPDLPGLIDPCNVAWIIDPDPGGDIVVVTPSPTPEPAPSPTPCLPDLGNIAVDIEVAKNWETVGPTLDIMLNEIRYAMSTFPLDFDEQFIPTLIQINNEIDTALDEKIFNSSICPVLAVTYNEINALTIDESYIQNLTAFGDDIETALNSDPFHYSTSPILIDIQNEIKGLQNIEVETETTIDFDKDVIWIRDPRNSTEVKYAIDMEVPIPDPPFDNDTVITRVYVYDIYCELREMETMIVTPEHPFDDCVIEINESAIPERKINVTLIPERGELYYEVPVDPAYWTVYAEINENIEIGIAYLPPKMDGIDDDPLHWWPCIPEIHKFTISGHVENGPFTDNFYLEEQVGISFDIIPLPAALKPAENEGISEAYVID